MAILLKPYPIPQMTCQSTSTHPPLIMSFFMTHIAHFLNFKFYRN